MKVAMPTGNSHGWGIAGAYLTAEIDKLSYIDGVTLHSVAGHHFAPTFADQWDRINIGYCFFESEILAYRFIPEAAERWNHIVAGSSWCEHHLRIAGMDRTSTILQGIDPGIFYPMPQKNNDGRFIVFSGGKFEFRKGHDLVIAAMKVFMNNHPDAWLACAWHNHWPASINTMGQSNYMTFHYRDIPCDQLFRELLAENGVPVERVIIYPVMENRYMQQIYAGSDVGLFPNRCEGGNNMVMCEYMACARPVIASTLTGHHDVVNSRNALCLKRNEPIISVQEGAATGIWFEASVDEIIEQLEHAYADRADLGKIGTQAGKDMTALSWQEAARKFHALGTELIEQKREAESKNQKRSTTPNLAAELFMSGRFDEAEQAYLELIRNSPLDPDLHNNLGTVLDRCKRYVEAVLHYEKALALRPGFTEARFNLANTLKRTGDTENAIKQLEAVVTASPAFIEAWQNLALCRLDNNNPAGAAEALERVLELEPGCVKSRIDLGDILVDLQRYEYAATCFKEVLLHDPDNAGVLNSLGIALQQLNELEAAESCYSKVLAKDPDNILALNNFGTLLRTMSLPEESIPYFNRALAQKPEDGQLLFNRSLARLLMGDFDQGWADYEGRFTSNPPVQLRHTDKPRWQGESLAGKTILVWCEQGYGDSIQFVRYAQKLADMGATVIIEAQDESIAPLLATANGVSQVTLRGSEIKDVDVQIPLLSLPGLLRNLPCPLYYLKVPASSVRYWGEQLGVDNRMKVGLAWSGRPTHGNDRNRSIPAHFFTPLAACEDVLFVSLQFSPADTICFDPPILDITSRLKHFVDSAALISNLDLVISVDSAVAHLAGALGIPAWVLLPYNPDWRWLLEREETPWYASIRLFRQHKPAKWHEVLDQVANLLNIQSVKKRLKI